MRPYIGITDFENFEQVQGMLRVFKVHLRAGSNRQLHIGVMMSHKTLHGLPTKWLSVFAPKETIAKIFASPETYNCLHYADYDANAGFSDDLSRAISFGGENIRAVQLDMIWPNSNQIAQAVLASGLRIEVILQINKNALDQVQNDPEALVRKLKTYDGAIQRVLLDKSMGRGLGMDAAGLLPFARAIRKSLPLLGIVAAGGLGPETMHLVEPLAAEFDDLSIDAQGRLRSSGSALDPIDWKIAETYIVKALQLLF